MRQAIFRKFKRGSALLCAIIMLLSAMYNNMLVSAAENTEQSEGAGSGVGEDTGDDTQESASMISISSNSEYYLGEVVTVTLTAPTGDDGNAVAGSFSVTKSASGDGTIEVTTDGSVTTFVLPTGEVGEQSLTVLFTPTADTARTTTETLSYKVNKLPLVITLSKEGGFNKVYDGTTDIEVNASDVSVAVALGDAVTDRVLGATAPESVTLNSDKLAFSLDSKNVTAEGATCQASIALAEGVVVSDLFTITADDASNYEVTAVNPIEVAVTPAELTCTVSPDDKNYDGNTDVSGINVSFSGAVEGDDVKLGVKKGEEVSEITANDVVFLHAGSASDSQTIAIKLFDENWTVALIGENAGNYSLESTDVTWSSAQITKNDKPFIVVEGIDTSSIGDYYYGEEVTVSLDAKVGEAALGGTYSVSLKKTSDATSSEEVAVSTEDGKTSFSLPTEYVGNGLEVTISFEHENDIYVKADDVTFTYAVNSVPVTISLSTTAEGGFSKPYDGTTTYSVNAEEIVISADFGEATGRGKAPSELTFVLDKLTDGKVAFALNSKNATTEGSSAKATLVTGESTSLYDLFGISKDNYLIQNTEVVIGVEVTKAPLKFAVTPSNKNYDMFANVEKISIECNGQIYFNDERENGIDDVELSLTTDNVVFEKEGNAANTTEGVGIKFVDGYTPALTGTDAGNYTIAENGIELGKANIIAQVHEIAVNENIGTDSYITFNKLYKSEDDTSGLYWCDGKISAKESYTIATELKAEEFKNTLNVVSDNNQFVIYVRDTAGDVSQVTYTSIVTDIVAPEISSQVEDTLSFGKTYKVSVSDVGSGISELKYKITENSNSTDVEGESPAAWTMDDNGVATITLNVPEYGYLYVEAIDNVGNVSEARYVCPVVVEEGKPTLKVEIDNNKVDSGAKVEGWDNTHNFKVTATDIGSSESEGKVSGIESITWKLIAPNGTVDDKVLLEKTITNENVPSSISEINATFVSGTINLNELAQDEKVSLDSSEPYTLVISAVDYCGNETENDFTVKLYFDNVAPTYSINIEKSQNGIRETVEEVENEKTITNITDYYNTGFDVNVIVQENASFDPELLELVVYKDNTKAPSVKAEANGWQETEDGWKCTYSINSLKTTGEDDGIYTFVLEGTDASNKAVVFESDVKHKVVYDITTPKVADISYGYKDDSGEEKDAAGLFIKDEETGRDYIREEVIVSLTVKEENLTVSSLGSITENGTVVENNIYDSALELKGVLTGDKNVITYIVGQRGELGEQQMFTVKIVDKAGNEAELALEGNKTLRCKEHTSFENGIFTDVFTVDMIAPVITNIAYTYVDEEGNETAAEGKIVEADDKHYYVNKEVTLEFTVDEHNLPNNSDVSHVLDEESLNPEWVWNKTEGSDIATETIEFKELTGNEQSFELTIVDRAGNTAVLQYDEVAEKDLEKALKEAKVLGAHAAFDKEEGIFTDAFTVDITAPVITNIAYTYVNEEGNKTAAEEKIVEADDNHYYVNKEVTLEFTVDEHNLPNNSDVSHVLDEESLNPVWEWNKVESSDIASETIEFEELTGNEQSFEVTIVDRAGNIAVLQYDEVAGIDLEKALKDAEVLGAHAAFDKENGIFTDAFTIDITAPVITNIAYTYVDEEGNETSAEGKIVEADDNHYYVNKEVTLEFTVDEHNLPDNSDVSHVLDEESLNPECEWNKVEGSDIATETIEFKELTGNEQSFEVTIEDRAGNIAVLQYDEVAGIDLEKALKEAKVLDAHAAFDKEKGIFTDAFTVDITAPVITTITYDTNGATFLSADDGLDYINEDVTITFEVDEHNLTYLSEMSITAFDGNLNTENVKVVDGKRYAIWKLISEEKADEYKAFFTVGQRGDYGDQQTSTITIVDRAGNTAELDGGVTLRNQDDGHTSFDSEKGTFTDVFTVDKVVPEVKSIDYTYNDGDEVKDATELFIKEADDGSDYVRKPITIGFTVHEHNLTNNSLGSITEYGAEVNPDKEYDKILDLTWSKAEDISKASFMVEMRKDHGDGDQQTSILTIKDRAGNEAVLALGEGKTLRCETHTTFVAGTFKDVFTVDTVAPEVTLSYDMTPVISIDETESTVDYFSTDSLQFKVSVNEHNFNRKNNLAIDVDWSDKAIEAFTEEAWIYNGDTNSKLYTLKEDSLYKFTITGTDRAGNEIVLMKDETEKIHPVQNEETKAITLLTAVDDTLPLTGDFSNPKVEILGVHSPSPSGSDICGENHPLYNSDVTYMVRVYDPLKNNYASGIDGITFKVTSAAGVEGTVTIDKDGTIHTAEGITVKLEKGTKGSLAKGEDDAYLYSVTLDSHVFNSNDIKLVVDAIDVSQNEMKAVEASLISIDITAPTVAVHYDNDAVLNEMYFKADRTAIITITERNWSEDCLSIDIVGGSLSGWNQSAGGDNGDGTTWTGYVHFSQEGPCSISVSTRDRAQNEQGGGTSYYGAAPQNFIIDKTAPVVSYSFDNNSVQNDKYYMAPRILTVNVVDAYFAGANDIVVLSDGHASGMTFNGMTANYAFVSDGVYSFRGTVTDLAGNVSAPFEGSEFVVDLTVPTVEFEGIEDQKAYGPDENFEPNVIFTDTNFYEGGVSFDLVRENWNGQEATISGNYYELMYMLGQRDTAPESRNELYQLTDTAEEIDGLYTLTVYVNDQAGNSNTHGVGDVIQFSVNRYGSVYLMDEATRAELSGYYMANIPDIVIHEYNLSDAAESWIDIITSAGERIRLEKDKDYTVASDAAEGCDWRMRTYTVLSENFDKDGEYTLEIYVKDDVNNVSTNNDPKAEGRGVSVNFIRDTEDPYVTLGGPEEGITYEASEMLLTVAYGDNIRMSMVAITVTDEDGNVLDTRNYAVPELNDKGEKVLPEGTDEELDIYSGQISYLLKENTSKQTITVIAKDAAGNDTSILEENGVNHDIPAISFTLTTNPVVLFYNNKPLFYGTIAGIVAVILLAVVLIKRRLDKKKQREA